MLLSRLQLAVFDSAERRWSAASGERRYADTLKPIQPMTQETETPRSLAVNAGSALWAVKCPDGELNHTTLDVRPDWAVKRWMDQEQLVTRTLCGHPVPSWEGYEAQGYSVVKCDLVERK